MRMVASDATELDRGDPRVARTRAAVLDVAVDLLIHGGTSAVTIEAIVSRSGVARSTIYRHWPRRIDLVSDTFRRLIPPLPDPPTDGDVGARLRAVLRVLADQIGGQPLGAVVPAVLESASRDPELSGFREAFAESQRAPLNSVLQQAICDGELPADLDIDEAVGCLVGPLFFRSVVFQQPIGADAADRIVDAFLRGFGGAT